MLKCHFTPAICSNKLCAVYIVFINKVCLLSANGACCFLINGTHRSLGIMIVEYMELFGSSAAETAMIQTTMAFGFAIFGKHEESMF